MTRPVCLGSNIHSVLFDPETLDFWVANADSKNPASHTRYTKYNLAELLKDSPSSEGKRMRLGAKLRPLSHLSPQASVVGQADVYKNSGWQN